MGTRGLRIVVFRGRYFIYYNHFDSYPSGLGDAIVCGIPSNPEEYRVWLESQRHLFADLTAQLEDSVLRIPEDRMRSLLAEAKTKLEGSGEHTTTPAWKAIDSELRERPSAIPNSANDLYIEWTYIVDLDSELFSVNNWITFNLNNIPRDRWREAFENDENGDVVFSFKICPEGSYGFDPPDYFAEASNEPDNYRTLYHQHTIKRVEAKTDVVSQSQIPLQQILALAVFEHLTDPFAVHFWEYLPEWSHQSFGFREVAFAILSLAAGHFTFEQPSRFYDKFESDGYLIGIRGDEAKLMSVFGSGCHMHDQEPGSSPQDSIYFLDNVLVSMVPNTVFQNDAEAAIGKAVTYGLAAGKSSFQVILFSVFSAILLEVYDEDGISTIRQTEVITIYNHTQRSQGLTHGDHGIHGVDGVPLGPFDLTRLNHAGFMALQVFFSTAAIRKLSVRTRGVFPTEIYGRIISLADRETQKACAKVSRDLHNLCQNQFWFDDDHKIVGFEPTSFLSSAQSSWDTVTNLGKFKFLNQTTGNVQWSSLGAMEHGRLPLGKQISTWCPVIGDSARQSMMTKVQLRVLM